MTMGRGLITMGRGLTTRGRWGTATGRGVRTTGRGVTKLVTAGGFRLNTRGGSGWLLFLSSESLDEDEETAVREGPLFSLGGRRVAG